eukprot:757305-Hanusia_phi.AAC.2
MGSFAGGMQFEVMCLPGMVDKVSPPISQRLSESCAVQGRSREHGRGTREHGDDCKTGDRPSSADIEKAFGHRLLAEMKGVSADLHAAAIQTSALRRCCPRETERKKKVDDKTRQIITYICGSVSTSRSWSTL